MLKYRIVTSLCWFVFLWLVIFILPTWFFALAATAVIALGLHEFFDMVSKKDILVYKYFGIITGCLIPISTYLQLQPSEEVEFMLITAICLAVFLLQFKRRKTEQALIGIATTIFGLFYISWLFSFIIKLRVAPPLNLDGKFVVLYLLVVAKSGDMAAYFIGSAFGKHQFIPHISPKKSVEGMIAGFIASFTMAIILRGLLAPVSICHILMIGLILSVISQVGDLSESLIKRDCKVKDSGSIFPGLGGTLDLIDSLLFTTPILYFYLRLIPQ